MVVIKLYKIYLSSFFQITTSQITIKCDISITFIIHLHSFRGSNIFKTIDQDIRMRCSPRQRRELHDRDKSGKIVNFPLWIPVR